VRREIAARSPVDRGKQGMKRSVACDGVGIPLHLVAARANTTTRTHGQVTLAPSATNPTRRTGTTNLMTLAS
jgi:hypothetical protein